MSSKGKLLLAPLLIGASALAFHAGKDAHASDAITVVSFGGAFAHSQIEAYHKPFSEKTGITVNSVDYNGGLAEIRAQAESGNVTWDVIDMAPSNAAVGCDEDILQPIDPAILPPAPDGTPAMEDFIEGTVGECFVATIVYSTIVAYDDTKFPNEKPTTIADLFDLEKFPGKRALRKMPNDNLQWALIADGVPREDVYEVLGTPEGVDRAFAKLDTIKDQTIWWEAGAQPPQMLADGEAAMVSAWNGRVFNAISKENKPFAIVWDHQVWGIDTWVVTKGTKNLQAALDFIAFSTDTQRLADQAQYISYGPARQSSFPLVVDKMKPHMPTAPENMATSIPNDYEFWADHQDELTERFNAWLLQ